MQRLTGMDASFLYLETPTSHMHVAMTGIYDTSTMPGGYSFEAFKDHIRSRLHLVPPFTRRLVEVPFQLHHPVWVNDPNFDLDHHVRRVTAPAPGGRRELGEIAGQIASIPLDRNRPLWEVWVVEGLKHNRIGFIAKVHHAAIDGASGAEIMTALYDLEPKEPPSSFEPVEAEHVPSDAELVSYAVASRLRRMGNLPQLLTRTVVGASNVVRNRTNPEGKVGAVPLTAPRTPWSAAITANRSVSFARIDLDEAKAVKDAFGVKLNDVVLAVVAGTLRSYLEIHETLPGDPLLAVVPVSVRTDEEVGSAGNRVSAMFASLATNLDDPVDRLRAIANNMEGAKTEHNAVGARMLTDWGEFAAPRTFAMASRLYSSMKLADRHRPIHNLVISNVPGPPFPLYLAGAELVAAYPMGPIHEGAGLNATVLSYRYSIDFGFMACPELIPDVWTLAEQVPRAFAELKEAAGIRTPTTASKGSANGSMNGSANGSTPKARSSRSTSAPKRRSPAKKKASGSTAKGSTAAEPVNPTPDTAPAG